MPSEVPINKTFAGLPENYCFTSWNQLFLDGLSAAGFYFPSGCSIILDQIDVPASTDRGNLWHKRIDDGADGAPTGRLYQFYGGKWVSPHYFAPGGPQRIWYEGSEASLWLLDGGDGGDPSSAIPTDTTGSFWQRDTNYDFRFPLAQGTSPKPTTVSIGDAGGAEEISLNANTMPAHDHFIAHDSVSTDLLSPINKLAYAHGAAAASTDYILYGKDETPTLGQTSEAGGDGSGTPVPFSIMPPYRVGMWAKRTVRIYFVG